MPVAVAVLVAVVVPVAVMAMAVAVTVAVPVISQRVLGVLDRFYLVFSTSSRREARAQRASRGTKEGRVERKSGKMRKRLSLSLPGFFFCSSRSLLSIVFSLRRL